MKTDQNKQRTIKNNGGEEDMKNKTTSIIDIIIKEIDNLMEQATKEKSHYYVKSVLEKCKSVIKLQAEEIKILWKHNKQRAYEIQKLHTYGDQYKKDYHDMKDERDEFKNKYYELIMVVGNKYEGETRHETALRYIKLAEQPLEGQVGKEKV